MKFCVCTPNYGSEVSVEGLKTFASKAEELGYDSLWTTDHIMVPREHAYPYGNILECLSTLAFLAGITERARLGVSALIIALRNPVIAAKQLATIDILCNGRLVVAIGVGWMEGEFRNLGASFEKRGGRVNESLRLLREVYCSDAPSFSGRHTGIAFKDIIFSPRPVQKDGPEIWIAGSSDSAMRRALEHGDAWHPIMLPFEEMKRLTNHFKKLANGKSTPIRSRVGLDGTKRPDESVVVGPQGDKRYLITGGPQNMAKEVEKYLELGIDYLVLAPNPNGERPAKAQLYDMRTFGEQVIPSF